MKVLIIAEEEKSVSYLPSYVRALGHLVVAAAHSEEGLISLVAQTGPHLIVAATGLNIRDYLRPYFPEIQICTICPSAFQMNHSKLQGLEKALAADLPPLRPHPYAAKGRSVFHDSSIARLETQRRHNCSEKVGSWVTSDVGVRLGRHFHAALQNHAAATIPPNPSEKNVPFLNFHLLQQKHGGGAPFHLTEETLLVVANSSHV